MEVAEGCGVDDALLGVGGASMTMQTVCDPFPYARHTVVRLMHRVSARGRALLHLRCEAEDNVGEASRSPSLDAAFGDAWYEGKGKPLETAFVEPCL